ncbi:hypothetical protein KDJ21_015730 [Metabacillus litoralis]|uniref:hypothetical protein n=1 Tax=Metabacillus TaxID=2675233 RepID=UPI001B95A0D2|nr:hypothetical protein [Metabacillus litoralis]MCM3163883.1 hypothetical protein [Metabacillus litoralis]MCM3410604.1 hypothetical protein [Metabacillus litoralis]UHA58309.1 hypothetical protein KDJ21_015730 [Metabacillus litoralis]
MSKKYPSFVKSEFFVDEPGNWHLKEGAPDEMKKELKEYVESLNAIQDEPGTIDSIHVPYPYSD